MTFAMLEMVVERWKASRSVRTECWPRVGDLRIADLEVVAQSVGLRMLAGLAVEERFELRSLEQLDVPSQMSRKAGSSLVVEEGEGMKEVVVPESSQEL